MLNFLNPFKNLEQIKKRVIRYFIPVTENDLLKMSERIDYLRKRNTIERNFIAKRTINIAPRISHTVTPKEWVSDPNHMQLNQWFNYVTSIREK